jgi:hypothetical protein
VLDCAHGYQEEHQKEFGKVQEHRLQEENGRQENGSEVEKDVGVKVSVKEIKVGAGKEG